MPPGARTIYAVATGSPDGAVAIVRVSGPRAGEVGQALAGGLPPPRELRLRRLVEPGMAGEEAMVVWMPGPGTYTGEDVLELHVHGGARNVGAVLEAVGRCGDVEPAGPGAFTRQAFENGKLGLTEAEGIAAVIGARTEAGLALARRLVAGELGARVRERIAGLAALRAEVEATLDFPDDVGAQEQARWRARLAEERGEVEGWLRGFEAGRRAREVSRVVIAGPPNAGKSALFNALLGRERALVADAPGTTRDYVEAPWRPGPNGVEAILVDTAGQREADEAVEAAGVERAREQMAGADLLLWVEGSEQAASARAPAGAEVMRVENKRDLGTRRGKGWIGVSARDGAGLPELVQEVARRLGAADEAPWIGLARHRDRAVEAAQALGRAEELAARGSWELVAFELGVARERLGEIVGEAGGGPVGAEVLDAVFASFCIGK